MKKKTIKLSVILDDPKEINLLFDKEKTRVGDKFIIDEDAHIELIGHKVTPGITNTEFFYDLVLNLAAGIPAGLYASWLYEKLGQSGKRKVISKETRKILIEEGDFKILIEETSEEYE